MEQDPPQNQSPPQENENAYQGTGTAAEGSKIYHAEIDPALSDLALENLRFILKGNGVKTENVEVTKFEGETLEFLAVTLLRLKTKLLERRQAGKVTGAGQVLANPRAVQDAVTKEENKITHSQDVVKRIKDVVLERPDRGFGLKGEYIRLPFLHKQFVVHEPCQACRSKGKMPCSHCTGKGQVACPRCKGNGTELCGACGGRQFLAGPNGQKQHCMHCNATGRKPCSVCNQRRQIACTACKGSCIITCSQCNGHAWNSLIFTAEIDAFATFEYNEESLPEKIHRHIRALDKHLPEYVEFKPVIMGREHEQDIIALPYQIRVPHADMIFTIRDKDPRKGQSKDIDLGAFMFGTKALLFDMPCFLEKLMAPGIVQLQDAGAGKGDVAQNLQNAGRYKTLRQIILAASRLSPDKALKAVMQKTPAGLSEDAAKRFIAQADSAMRKLTRRPRQIGMLVGSALTAGFYGLWFHLLRMDVIKTIPPLPMIYTAIDALVFLLGLTGAVFAIKWTAGRTIHKTLAALTRQENQKMKLAKAGRQAYRAISLSTAAFAIAAASTLSTHAPVPDWVAKIHTLIAPFLN